MKCQAAVIAVAVAGLSACGGSGNGSSSAGDAASNTYRFVTPTIGVKNTFSDTLVDNLNNTINRTLVENVTVVNADGSFTAAWNDPNNNSITTGTVNHAFYPTTSNYSNVAQQTSRTIAPPNVNPVSCLDAPHGDGAPSPLSAGQTWSFTYTETCGASNPVTYTHSGTYVGTESITVPAGTFVAYKFQSTLTWTTGSGTIVTESIIHWRNTASTDSLSLKEIATFAYSGTAPAQGSLVSLTRVLQNRQ